MNMYTTSILEWEGVNRCAYWFQVGVKTRQRSRCDSETVSCSHVMGFTPSQSWATGRARHHSSINLVEKPKRAL